MTDRTHLDLTKALVAAGIVLYIPANFLPVMTITITGDVEALTILGGVQELADSGLMPVAVLVFFASIVIPFVKLVCMCWLLMLHGSDRLRPQRAKAFHILHQVGTWSMIDIFLLSVLAAVGQLGILASVEPQPGVVFFAAVLLCTLFAADIYQPRMIWKPSPTA
ncbi:MAG: paraquat-inducible protein A [Verrucomicrobia bacterium]|nr:paraquat-inducible protein A [Verrucomicrobiota bacterium]